MLIARIILRGCRTAGVIDVRGDLVPARAPPALARVFVMRQFQVTPPSQDIVHPTCAKCGAPMWLTRIEPDEPGVEKRTFECQACQNEAIELVKHR